MHAARARRSSLRDGEERKVGQTPVESLHAALRTGDELLFFVQAHADGPYALRPPAAPVQNADTTPKNRQDHARDTAAVPHRQQRRGPRLRNLLSFDRDRERERTITKGIAEALADAPLPEVVLELYGVVRSHHSTAHKPNFVVYRALDNTVSRAAHIVQSWPLASLKSVDGLGAPTASATQFRLLFAEQPAFTLTTDNPSARARFLWSLIQLFAHELKRTPPTTGLLLLELQSFVDEVNALRLNQEQLPSVDTSAEKKTSTNASRRNSLGTDEVGHRSEESVDQDFKQTNSHQENSGSQNNMVSRDRPRMKHDRSSARLADHRAHAASTLFESSAKKLPNIFRTVSEPNPSISVTDNSLQQRNKSKQHQDRGHHRANRETIGETAGNFESEDDDELLDGPVAMRQQPATAAGVADALRLQNNSSSKAMNIDQRAFLVAASRLGGMTEPFGDSPSALLAERRRAEEEKRAFQLSATEVADFDFVVSSMLSRQDVQLWDMESWLEAEIARREVSNIAEMLAVEKDAPAFLDPLCRLRGVLTESESWFRKWGAQLAPHADIVAEANNQILSLEVQRRNVMSLDSTLEKLVTGLLLSPKEESEMEDMFSEFETLSKTDAFSIDDAFIVDQAIPMALILSRKVNYSPEHESLFDISAVASYRKRLLLMRRNLIMLLLPVLRGTAEKVAAAQEVNAFVKNLDGAANVSPESCRSQAKMIAFCKAAYAATVLETATAERLCCIYERCAAKESSPTNDSLEGIRQLWNAYGGNIRVQLESATERLAKFVTGEGQVAMKMFKGVAVAMGISAGVLVTRLLMSQFQNLVASFDKLIDTLARNRIELYWIAYLFLEHQASEKYRQAVLCGAEHASLRADCDQTTDQSVAIYSEYDAPRSSAGHREDVMKFGSHPGHSISETNDSFASARSSFFLSSNMTVASPVLGSNQTYCRPPISLNGHETVMDGVVVTEDSDTSAIIMFLSNMLNERARRIRILVDVQVGEAVSTFPSRTSADDESSFRSSIFDSVQSRMEICRDIAAAWHTVSTTETGSMGGASFERTIQPQSFGTHEGVSRKKSYEETKAICDRLVAAAMKTIETAAIPGPGRRPELIKVECYTCMAVYLSDWSKSYDSSLFSDVLDLSQRAKRNAIAMWSERVVRTHFGGILDAAHAAPGSLMVQLQMTADHFGVSEHVMSRIREDVLMSLSSGARSMSLDTFLWPYATEAISSQLDAAVKLLERRGSSTEQAALAKFRKDIASGQPASNGKLDQHGNVE